MRLVASYRRGLAGPALLALTGLAAWLTAWADSVNVVPVPSDPTAPSRIVRAYMWEYQLSWREEGARPEKLRKALKRPPEIKDRATAATKSPFQADNQRTNYEPSLTLRESAFTPAHFARIDANRDGYIVFDELWDYCHKTFIQRAAAYRHYHGPGAGAASALKITYPWKDPVLSAAEKKALDEKLREARVGLEPEELAYALMKVEATDYAKTYQVWDAMRKMKLPVAGSPPRGDDGDRDVQAAVLAALADAGYMVESQSAGIAATATADGVVAVYGMVGAAAQKQEIVNVAKAVRGVKEVKATLYAVGEKLPDVEGLKAPLLPTVGRQKPAPRQPLPPPNAKP